MVGQPQSNHATRHTLYLGGSGTVRPAGVRSRRPAKRRLSGGAVTIADSDEALNRTFG